MPDFQPNEHGLFSASTEHITIYRVHAPDGTVIWQCTDYAGGQLCYHIVQVLDFFEGNSDALMQTELEQLTPEGKKFYRQMSISHALKSAEELRAYEHYAAFPDRIKRAVEAIG